MRSIITPVTIWVGNRNIAWDVVGAVVELDLSSPESRRLVEQTAVRRVAEAERSRGDDA